MLKRARYKLDKFFPDLSSCSNYLPEDSIKEVYYGLIKLIGIKLLKDGKIDCPDLGEFVLHTYPVRNAFDIATKSVKVLPPKSVVRFRPCRKMKDHFHETKEEYKNKL